MRSKKRDKSTDSSPCGIKSMADFAAHLGLSRATVSRVLNKHPRLSQDTIDRVRRAMKETGFTPNAHATLLRRKIGKTVGISVETLATAPTLAKLDALQRGIHDAGYSSLIEVMRGNDMTRVTQHFMSMRTDLVVFIIGWQVPPDLDERLGELRRRGVPHLVIDYCGVAESNMVAVDRALAMDLLFGHLLEQGHRRFGLMGIPLTPRGTNERIHGIYRALERNKLDPASCLVSQDDAFVRGNDFEYGMALAGRLVSLDKSLTALVALNDEIAVGAIRGLQKKRLRVPQDVAVTGFNNQDICSMVTPLLTSVDHNVDAMMARVLRWIIGVLNEESDDTRTFMWLEEPKLVLRESSSFIRSIRA